MAQTFVSMKVNILGARKLEAQMGNPAVVGAPVRWFLIRTGNYLRPRVARRIPARGVNRHGYRRTGRGRRSIQMALDTGTIPRWVKVFSPVHYIRFLEYGTKRGIRPRRMFRGTLRRARRAIFGFAKQARDDIARNLRPR